MPSRSFPPIGADPLDVLADRVSRLERHRPGAGGPLGSAVVEFTWTGTALSNGAEYDASAVTILGTTGAPDVSTTGGNTLISAATTPSLYIVSATLYLQPTTNAVSTDVHMVDLFVPGLGQQQLTFIGTVPAHVGFAGWVQRDTPTYDVAFFSFICTGGTNRVYDGPPASPALPIRLDLSMVRFPAGP